METIQGMQNTYIFTKVAQNGSFTEAGKQLGVSKAYISKAVQNLENELGKRLLNRTTRQVKLTFYGEQFFEICEKNYQNILREKELIISTSTTPKGPLKISLAGAFGEKFILPLVLEFVNLYPEKKLIYVSFKFKCFYISDTGKNIFKIVVPLDVFKYLKIIINNVFLKLL